MVQRARDGIDAIDVDAQRTSDVAHRRLGAVADDHAGERGAMATVLLVEILDHLFAALVLEVEIDVGGLAALLADEAFEQHLAEKRIDLGDAQAITDCRIGRAAATLAKDAVGARPSHDVGHREEVGLVPQATDQPELVLDQAAHLVGDAGGKAS